jgi:DNA (cytosine-5)-methyltransferase 1
MTHGSLFSGIGGFDLAAEWVGWDNVFHCEYNPFAQKVLKHHFPNSKLYEDVRTFDATAYAGRIDIISGGFPCQPFSAAGKRKGTQDERHLWPEMLRIIHEVAPSYVVGENVRGLINWNGGLVFEEVCADLEAAGYEVTPYLLPACGKNAPHRRDRIWFIAYKGDATNTKNNRHRRGCSKGREEKFNGLLPRESERGTMGSKTKRRCGERTSTNTDFELSKCGNRKTKDRRSEQKERTKPFSEPRGWEKFPTEPAICRGDDGLSKELDSITFSNWRKESIKAYGNAIVPQVAYEIFKAINKIELSNE